MIVLQVSVLSGSGHSCHWFTGTADPSQSVFKPFIFTEGVLNSKHIIADGDSTTLYKFHQKAKHTNELQTLLRDLEQRCIAVSMQSRPMILSQKSEMIN